MAYDRYGWDPRLIDDDPMSQQFTVADLREAARRFLDTSRYVQVTLVPETTASSGVIGGSRP